VDEYGLKGLSLAGWFQIKDPCKTSLTRFTDLYIT